MPRFNEAEAIKPRNPFLSFREFGQAIRLQ